MPMYDSLADQIKYFLLNGGDYHVAPNLGSDVLDRIDAFAARFLGYSRAHRHTHVLWVAHCWLMDCWEHTPRLLFVSPEPNCGKTTAPGDHPAFRSTGTGTVSNLTEAALYQPIEDTVKDKGGRPTILHDQLDKLFGNGSTADRKNGKVENHHRNRLPAQRHHQAQDEGPLQSTFDEQNWAVSVSAISERRFCNGPD